MFVTVRLLGPSGGACKCKRYCHVGASCILLSFSDFSSETTLFWVERYFCLSHTLYFTKSQWLFVWNCSATQKALHALPARALLDNNSTAYMYIYIYIQIGTFTAWNRTRNRTRTPSEIYIYIYAGQLPAGPLNTFPESQFGDHKK